VTLGAALAETLASFATSRHILKFVAFRREKKSGELMPDTAQIELLYGDARGLGRQTLLCRAKRTHKILDRARARVDRHTVCVRARPKGLFFARLKTPRKSAANDTFSSTKLNIAVVFTSRRPVQCVLPLRGHVV